MSLSGTSSCYPSSLRKRRREGGADRIGARFKLIHVLFGMADTTAVVVELRLSSVHIIFMEARSNSLFPKVLFFVFLLLL